MCGQQLCTCVWCSISISVIEYDACVWHIWKTKKHGCMHLNHKCCVCGVWCWLVIVYVACIMLVVYVCHVCYYMLLVVGWCVLVLCDVCNTHYANSVGHGLYMCCNNVCTCVIICGCVGVFV